MPALGLRVFFLSGVLGLESTLSRGKEEIAEDTALWRTDALPDADPVIRQAVVAADGAESAKQASFSDLDHWAQQLALDPPVGRDIWAHQNALDPWKEDAAGKTLDFATDDMKAKWGAAGLWPDRTEEHWFDPLYRRNFPNMFYFRVKELEEFTDEVFATTNSNLDTALISNLYGVTENYLKNALSTWPSVEKVNSRMRWMFGVDGGQQNEAFWDNEEAAALMGEPTNWGAPYRGASFLFDGEIMKSDRQPLTWHTPMQHAKPEDKMRVFVELHFRYFFHQVMVPYLKCKGSPSSSPIGHKPFFNFLKLVQAGA